jgi:hypothetical protein
VSADRCRVEYHCKQISEDTENSSLFISEIHYGNLHFHSRTFIGSCEYTHYMQKLT